MNHKHSRRNMTAGFTMVELTLAMAFVAVLMLVIASTVIQMGNIYNKGITMKAVEQAGRLITSDIRQTVSQGRAISLKDNCLYQTNDYPGTSTGSLAASCLDNSVNPSDIIAGRFCTGRYSYIWNYGKATLDNLRLLPVNKYSDNSDDMIRFVRVNDTEGLYCRQTVTSPLPAILKSDATELLSGSALTGSEMALAIYNFRISEASKSNSQTLYKFSMRLGTDDTEYIETGGDCKTPNQDVQAQNFCAVNVFGFTALNDIMGSQ